MPKFRDALVDYALSLKASHAVSSPDFEVTSAMRDELSRRMTSRGVTIPRAVYDSAAPLVSRALATQLSRYVFGPRAEFARNLRDDPAMTSAIGLLRGVQSPKALLERAPGAKGR